MSIKPYCTSFFPECCFHHEACNISSVLRPLLSGFSCVCSSSFFSRVALFLWHHDGERQDVLRLLHRGHVNHASAEGERALRSFDNRGKSRKRHIRYAEGSRVLFTYGGSRSLYRKGIFKTSLTCNKLY